MGRNRQAHLNPCGRCQREVKRNLPPQLEGGVRQRPRRVACVALACCYDLPGRKGCALKCHPFAEDSKRRKQPGIGIMTAPSSNGWEQPEASKMYIAGSEKTVKELIRDVRDNLTPDTAAIIWPGLDFVEVNRGSIDGDGEFRQALTQNTSLKELLLVNPLHPFENGEVDPEMMELECEDDPEEIEFMVNQFSSEIEEYRKSLEEVKNIVTALPANVKVLSIANWVPDWTSMPTCESIHSLWLAHVKMLAQTLEINTTLETLDLRTRERNSMGRNCQTGEISCPWPRPFASQSSFDVPSSEDMYMQLGYDISDMDFRMRTYIAIMRLSAPLKLGKAIKERCYKGIPTTLKGVPLSYAKEALELTLSLSSSDIIIDDTSHDELVEGVPLSYAKELLGLTLSLSPSDDTSHDEYNRVCIERWLEEGRERLVALGMGLSKRLGGPADAGNMRTRAATKKNRGCPFYGLGPDVFRLICGR